MKNQIKLKLRKKLLKLKPKNKKKKSKNKSKFKNLKKNQMKVVRKKIGGAAKNGGIGRMSGKISNGMDNGKTKNGRMEKEKNGNKNSTTKLLNLLMKEFKP